MLVQALTDHFNTYFDQASHNDTALWFDPPEEYAGLLDHLTRIPLWRHEGSLLQLRYKLITRGEHERTVVYLHLPQEDAEVLRPFFATSLIFRERLYRFLRRQGLDFPDDPQVAHELRALLPRLAARSVGKGRAFWKYNLANLERARDTLLGNFDDALLRFLAQPEITLSELTQEKLDGLFFAQLESAYGLAVSSEGDPSEVARRLTAQLALVRAFTDAGQPADFPYAAQLPEPLHFTPCCAFLDRWQRDNLYKTAYTHLADGLEKLYDLAGWATALPATTGLGLMPTFGNVESALWKNAEAGMDDLESEADWRDWLMGHRPQFEARARSFWAVEGRSPAWGLLTRAADLLAAAHGARDELDRLATPEEMLQRYADSWWRIDQDFRLLRQELDAQPKSHDRLRDRCARSYREILHRMNDRFSTLLEAEGHWPPAAVDAQDAFWAQIMEVSKPEERMAIMFIDALRYELGRELWQALENDKAGDRREVLARIAAIPTITPIGMTALLPGGDRRQVSYGENWEITIDDSGDLMHKDARRSWMHRHLEGAAFYNLEELVSTPTDQIPEASAYVVFDTTLDAVGEMAGALAWNTFSKLLQSVKIGIHKLLELGVEQVHVVADHGFLLLDQVAEHEKVTVRDVPALAKKSRYLVGSDLGTTSQLLFPVPGSRDLLAWFPRGIGCFRTPGAYNYAHGGLSLQELVVPHLTVVQQVMGRPVGIRVELPTVIHSAQFKVTVEPVSGGMFDQPRQVSLTLEKAGQPVIPPLSHTVRPAEGIEIDVFLPMGCGLQPGDKMRWQMRDAVTEEVLAEQEATSQVDLW